ncbi:MAG: EAL domain-containing protein [Bacillota bacterium]
MQSFKGDGLLNIILNQTRKTRLLYTIINIGILTSCYILVYFTGGTQNAYLHTFYIPVVIGGLIFGSRGGLVTGIIAGVLLGPLMPFNTASGEMQPIFNWIYRMLIFMALGFLTGLVFDRVRRQYVTINRIYTHSLDTGIPNYYNYLTKFDENAYDEADVSLTIMINNYEDIVVLIGRENYAKILIDIHQELLKHFDNANIIQVDNRKFWIETDQNAFKSQFSQIIRRFDDMVFYSDDMPMFIEMSIGVYLSDKTVTRLEAFKYSEIAALHAKREQLKYAIYQEDFEHTQRNLERLGALPLAVKNNELFLEYHPIVDLKTNEVTALEALVRWEKDGVLTPPLDFIPLAEETKIIDNITEWVFKQVIEENKRISEYKNLDININISQRNLYNPALVDRLIDMIKKENYQKNKIGIEMTESTLMLNLHLTKSLLETFKQNDVPLLIDDFGVGYSTMSTLSELPVHKIKIDRHFIDKMIKEDSTKKLVELIVNYAHVIGIEVVAEGTEDETYEALLKDVGCDYSQGFYYTKPLRVDNMIAWLKNRDKK